MSRSLIAIFLAALVASVPAQAGEAKRAADRFARAASTIEGIDCFPRPKARTIACLVRTDDRGLGAVASGLIMQARAYDYPLVGWSLMLVNPSDYVVSRNF